MLCLYLGFLFSVSCKAQRIVTRLELWTAENNSKWHASNDISYCLKRWQVWGLLKAQQEADPLMTKGTLCLLSVLFRVTDAPQVLIFFLLKWMQNILEMKSLNDKKVFWGIISKVSCSVWTGLCMRNYLNSISLRCDIYVPENVIFTGSQPTSSPRDVVSSWRAAWRHSGLG